MTGNREAAAAARPRRRGAARRISIPMGATVVVPAALASAAAVGYAAASIFRHDRFGSNAYDLGLFDQTIWGYSRLDMLPNTVVRLPNALGDHFHPILVLLAPLYWIWDDAGVLLVAQAVLLAAASVPIFLWARQRLGLLPAICFQTAYLIFWAVLAGNIFDFHELAVAAPIVSVALYAALTRHSRLLWAAAALGFLTREDMTLAFVGIGLFLLLQSRFRQGLALIAASLVWFVLTIKLVIPAFADRPYQQWYYTQLGEGPGGALLHVLGHPLDTIRILVTPHEKLTSLVNLFAPWLLLPLASPLIVVALPALAARFLSDKPSHWAPQGFHYSLLLAPMLAFAAIDGTERLARLGGARGRTLVPAAAGLLCVLGGAYFSFVRLKPLDELRRYTSAEHAAEIRRCIETIPPDASVAATSALVPHLSHRDRIYVLDHRTLPQTAYYAIDLYTWTFPFTVADARSLVEHALRRGYGVVCSSSGTAVLARGAVGGTLSPELRQLLRG